MTCHQVCNWRNTTGATSGAGTTYPCGAPEFNNIKQGSKDKKTIGFCKSNGEWKKCCSLSEAIVVQ